MKGTLCTGLHIWVYSRPDYVFGCSPGWTMYFTVFPCISGISPWVKVKEKNLVIGIDYQLKTIRLWMDFSLMKDILLTNLI